MKDGMAENISGANPMTLPELLGRAFDIFCITCVGAIAMTTILLALFG